MDTKSKGQEMKGSYRDIQRGFLMVILFGTLCAYLVIINNDTYSFGNPSVINARDSRGVIASGDTRRLKHKAHGPKKKKVVNPVVKKAKKTGTTVKNESIIDILEKLVLEEPSPVLVKPSDRKDKDAKVKAGGQKSASRLSNVDALNKNIYDNVKLNQQIQEARESIQQLLKQESLTSAVPVLLVAYMRSGSSWLGDITRQAKDSFYLFEPFQFFIEQAYYTSGLVCYYNDQCRQPLKDVESHHIVMKSLLQIYTCDLKSLHSRTKKNILRKMKGYCLQPGQEKISNAKLVDIQRHGVSDESANDTDSESVDLKHVSSEACIDILTNMCKNAKHRIVKTIRFSMDLVQTLMVFIPNLKVIHLVRDPRAITQSRSHSGNMKMSKETEAHSKALCKEMLLDVQVGGILKRKYPVRITTVKYESLADRPVDGAKFVYKFLQAKFTKSVKVWIYESTHADKNNGFYGTARSNSTAASSHWRKQTSFEQTELIQEYCSNVMDSLGYVDFKNVKDLRNIDLPATKPVDIPGFI